MSQGDHEVTVRLVGNSQVAVDQATAALAEAIAMLMQPVELRMRAARAGRHGDWLAYGKLTLASPAHKETDGEDR